MGRFSLGRKVRRHNGSVEENAGPLVERRPRIARRIMLSVISLLMKTKITPKLEAERRSKRRTYRRRARKRALARLREGMDLQWTPPRSRGELHQR